MTGGARSLDVVGSVADTNSPLQKQIPVSNGCCLKSQARAQSLKPGMLCCRVVHPQESQWRGRRGIESGKFAAQEMA